MTNQTVKRPILVTGAHRTGTTWVGKMLAAGSQTAYVSEPLNVLHRRGILDVPIERWYTYICEQNEGIYLAAFQNLLRLRYNLGAELAGLRTRKDGLRMGRDLAVFTRGRLRQARLLIKDPFAVLSLDWFTRRLGCQIVVTVRHPAAFASSLKRLNWPFDFSDLLAQPLLMQAGLESFRTEMEALASNPGDILGQAALLWKIIYTMVDKQKESLPELRIVKHEDLSLDPIGGFRELYAALGLDFTAKVEKTILNSSSADNPAELSRTKVHSVRLDSRQNLQNWKKRLTPQEIEHIRRVVGEAAKPYYGEADW